MSHLELHGRIRQLVADWMRTGHTLPLTPAQSNALDDEIQAMLALRLPPELPPRPSPYLEQFKAEVWKSLENHKESTRAHMDVMKAEIARVNNRIDKKFERHNRRFHADVPRSSMEALGFVIKEDPAVPPGELRLVNNGEVVARITGIGVGEPEPKG